MASTFKLRGAALAALLAIPLALPARASTATTTFAVTATVLSGCAVVATDLVFGNYSSTNGSPTDAQATAIVTCTSGVSYAVAADAGAGTAATEAQRAMTGAIMSGSLNYGLFTAANHTTPWGDGTLGTSTFGGKAALLPQSYTVHGRIPTAQHSTAGLHADLVTVTLTY
jgi:spore coat protein U domain-containing protein, fimbrial subunit CupE1/2/3/6